MSEFNSLLGRLSGKIGDVVFYQRGGTTFVKRRPSKRSTPYTELEKKQHSKFGFACKLSSKIGSIGEIKHFWKPERQNGRSSCNKIFKENYRLINKDTLEANIKLTPDYGFSQGEYAGKINKDGLQIEFAPAENPRENYGANLKFVMAAGVIILKSPREKKRPAYEIISFRTEKTASDLAMPIRFRISIEGLDLKFFKGYKERKAYFTIITLDKAGTPIKYSKTFLI